MSSSPWKKFSLRHLLLLLALALLLITIAATSFYFLRTHRRSLWLQEILQLAESGLDDQRALQHLNAFLLTDPHQELAYAQIAEIYQRSGDWSKAAAAWQHAASLNATRSDYAEARLTALFRSQNYALLASALSLQQKQETLQPEQKVLLALALLRTGKREQAEEVASSITDLKILAAPAGKLLQVFLQAATSSHQELIAALTECTLSEEPAVAFDAMNTLAGIAFDDQQPEIAEKWLLEASRCLPETGEVLLANFYFLQQRFDLARPLYEKALRRGSNPQLAAHLGEIYASGNEREAILALQEDYRLGSKQHLQAAYYLEALLAFMDRNDAELANALKYLDNVYHTPVAMLMTLYSALQQNQVVPAVKALQQIRNNFLSDTIQERIQAITMPYLTRLLEERRIHEAAQIAAEMRVEQQPVLLLEQIVLTDQMQRGILDPKQLETALQTFPDDRQIVTVAAKYYLEQQNFAAALQQAKHSLQIGDNSIDMQLIYFSALEGMNKLDELQQAFDQARQEHPDNTDIAGAYLHFCRRYGKTAELTALQTQLQGQAEPALQALAYLAAAELHWLQKDRPAMHTALKQAMRKHRFKTDNFIALENIYRTAFLLAGADDIEMAIKLYEEIVNHYQAKPMLLLNLSELYAAAKQPEKALAAALHARQLAPDWPPASECYGIRLLETKEYAKAVEALAPLIALPMPSARTVTNWTTAMQELIKKQFQEKQWQECQQSCDILRRHNPEDEIAREYAEKLKAQQQLQ